MGTSQIVVGRSTRWRARRLALAVTVVALAVPLFSATSALAATPSITVTPSTGLARFQQVQVSGSGFAASPHVSVLQCAAVPLIAGQSPCDVNGSVQLTPDGSGSFGGSSAVGPASLAVHRVLRSNVTTPVQEYDCAVIGCFIVAAQGVQPSQVYATRFLSFAADVVVDADLDGVQDVVDADGGAGSSPAGAFVDGTGDTHVTAGSIVATAGLMVSVEDAPDPQGVRVTTTGSGGPAELSVCPGTTLQSAALLVPADTSTVVTCGSVAVSDVSGGPVTIRLPGGVTTVTVPTEGSAKVDWDAAGGFSIANVEGTVTLNVDGVSQPVTTAVTGASWDFVGFSQPVDNGSAANTLKAGEAVPLKWRLLDAYGNPVMTLASATIKVQGLACVNGATQDQIEETVPGGSGLKNLGNGYYQLNWKTPTSYARSCKTLMLDIGDGVTHNALFSFTK